MKKLTFIITCILLLCKISFAERNPHLAPTPISAQAKELEKRAKQEGLEKFILRGKENQIFMDKDGKIFINSKPISMGNIDALLHLIDPKSSVSVKCDKHANPALVAQLIHKIRYSHVKTSN